MVLSLDGLIARWAGIGVAAAEACSLFQPALTSSYRELWLGSR